MLFFFFNYSIERYCLKAFLHLLGEEIPNHLTADFRMAIGFLVFCDI